MEELNDVYKDFIKNELYADKEKTPGFINTLFSLHNNFVDVTAPEFGKSCSACIRRVLNKVRNAYLNFKHEI